MYIRHEKNPTCLIKHIEALLSRLALAFIAYFASIGYLSISYMCYVSLSRQSHGFKLAFCRSLQNCLLPCIIFWTNLCDMCLLAIG